MGLVNATVAVMTSIHADEVVDIIGTTVSHFDGRNLIIATVSSIAEAHTSRNLAIGNRWMFIGQPAGSMSAAPRTRST